MLKNVPALLSPDMLHALAAMGHGDELAIVDANFPAAACAASRPVLYAPGSRTPELLDAVLTLLPLDDFLSVNAWTMRPVDGDGEPPAVADINAVLDRYGGSAATLERHEFYDRARSAFAVICCGERRLYGNALVTKGVVTD